MKYIDFETNVGDNALFVEATLGADGELDDYNVYLYDPTEHDADLRRNRLDVENLYIRPWAKAELVTVASVIEILTRLRPRGSNGFLSQMRGAPADQTQGQITELRTLRPDAREETIDGLHFRDDV